MDANAPTSFSPRAIDDVVDGAGSQLRNVSGGENNAVSLTTVVLNLKVNPMLVEGSFRL